MIRRRLSCVSVLALTAACLAPTAEAQQALPTINVGGRQARTAAVAKPKPAAAPVTTTVSAPAPAPAPTEPAEPVPTEASQSFSTGAQVNAIPVQRPGEALEVVPGLAVTQHSGEGKANQYWLRGFNLDHGTDLALWLDGMPLNMRTHGHGQGYSDANFLIPELIGSVLSRKGPYNAQDGDFSNAGSVYINYISKLPQGLVQATGGSFGYGRLLGIKSWEHGGGDVLGAVESTIYNGPWERPDSTRKINSVLRWSRGTQEDGMSLTGMAYANRWYSTDQIPQRAVDEGVLSRWGTMNPTDGGDTTRFSLSGRWSEVSGNQYSRVEAYAIHSTLDLYNDFTYFLANPILGDQFRQFDRRTLVGGQALHGVNYTLAGFPAETRLGLQGRYDDIRVGLQDSFRRTPYDAVRNDHVGEGSVSLWTDTKVKWTPWLTTIAGARLDFYQASVGSLQDYLAAPHFPFAGANPFFLWTGPFNSGSSSAQLISPKASVILGPWEKTELFLNFGRGFHSDDARGTTQIFDTLALSETGSYSRVTPIPLLSPSTGAEIGVRTKAIDTLDSSLALFWIDMQSENQFQGDTGTTVFGRPSRRVGIEFNNHWRPLSWVNFDGDLAVVNARYRGFDTEQAQLYTQLLQPDAVGFGTFLGNAPGNFLVNAVPIVATATFELGEKLGWFGALKYRYLSARALTEDAYLKAPATGTLNIRLGYRWEGGWKFQIDGFNILNSRSDQITYGYGSLIRTDPLYGACLAGAAPGSVCGVGVMDRHFKPVEPPAFRLTLSGPLSFDQPVLAKAPDLGQPFASLPF